MMLEHGPSMMLKQCLSISREQCGELMHVRTDVLTKNFSPWDACTYVSYRAQGGCKIHPIRGRKSDFARRPDLSMCERHPNFKDRRAS